MCGFIGRINSGGTAPGAGPGLRAGLRFLRRRGPDSDRLWSSAYGRVGLLHARLAIVDTDARAHQPFADEERGVAVVFNGEIYNYPELRRELDAYPFRTNSDTEVLLALYARHGVEGLKRLRGMFALAVVDGRARRVFLARDPVGKKPLYVARWGGGVYFGSSVLPLVAASGARPCTQAHLLDGYWEDGYVSPRESILEGCAPVMPGRVVEFDWDGVARAERSCAPEAADEPAPASLPEVHERLSYLLGESVRRRLTNNPNPVCLLSGGIDSTVVAGHMSRQVGGSAITLASLIPRRLDEGYARFAARRLGMPLRVVGARRSRLADDIVWALDLQDEPLGVMSFFPLALLIRSASDYGKILLTGDGGDEVFLGYGRPADWVAGPGSGAPSDGGGVRVGLPVPEWMTPWGREMVGASLLGHMFTKLDRASAEQGVEARCPLLDWDLLAFVRKLSPETFFFDGQPKALLKAQLAGWPRWFVRRPKVGFAYRLRWEWGLRCFAGLRELVTDEAVETFAPRLPAELRRRPGTWRRVDVFRNFSAAWKLLAWSRFTERLRGAAAGALLTPPEAEDRVPSLAQAV